MIVVAQAPEVVEGYHLQVGPGEGVRQLLSDGFEDAHSRQRASRRAGDIVLRYRETMYQGDSESQRYS